MMHGILFQWDCDLKEVLCGCSRVKKKLNHVVMTFMLLLVLVSLCILYYLIMEIFLFTAIVN